MVGNIAIPIGFWVDCMGNGTKGNKNKQTGQEMMDCPMQNDCYVFQHSRGDFMKIKQELIAKLLVHGYLPHTIKRIMKFYEK